MQPDVVEYNQEEFNNLKNRLVNQKLNVEDYSLILGLLNAYEWMVKQLRKSKLTIKKLRELFIKPTEKLKNILKKNEPKSDEASSGFGSESGSETLSQPENDAKSSNVNSDEKDNSEAPPDKKKPAGHGRIPASAYTGAEEVFIPHESLKIGDKCPNCSKGTMNRYNDCGVVLRLTASPPIQGTKYKLEKFRCSACRDIFTAKLPEEAGVSKYDETVGPMIAVLRYGRGIPHYRLEQLQKNMGTPLPAATQWDLIEITANEAQYAYKELERLAAQGEVLHTDDTNMKILDKPGEEDPANKRKKSCTTAIVSINDDKKIVIYCTGFEHAGDNIEKLLEKRDSDLTVPLQMCDALPANTPKSLRNIILHCLSHGRRNFCYQYSYFPKECGYVLKILAQVYHNDDVTKERKMTPEQRLEYHQKHSKPLMEELHDWMRTQIDKKIIEKNSSMGKAINYMLKRWEKFTRFLVYPNAPLDNNICERALKKAIIHRKNSLFYKNSLGAKIGDMFMSIIHTCELAEINAFDYLTEIVRHSKNVRENPSKWMPWNYKDTLESMKDPGSELYDEGG